MIFLARRLARLVDRLHAGWGTGDRADVQLSGTGKFTFTAIGSRDYSFIQGQLLLLTTAVLVANLLSDIANVILDPRLRKG